MPKSVVLYTRVPVPAKDKIKRLAEELGVSEAMVTSYVVCKALGIEHPITALDRQIKRIGR